MSTDRDHDAACPWRRLTVMARVDCQFCPVLARARADERERIAQYVRGSTEFWDALATEIRRVDGNHTLGAAAMAEELVPFIAATIAREDT